MNLKMYNKLLQIVIVINYIFYMIIYNYYIFFNFEIFEKFILII
jgi:hypothetical protein